MSEINVLDVRARLANDPNPNKLVLEIGRESLPIIRAAQLRIVLGRSATGTELSRVVWMSVDPFELNTVTWGTAYGLYASITEPVTGATVTVVSREEIADPGFSYTYTSSAVFMGPQTGNVPAGNVGVLNQMPASSYPSMLFGLDQGATVQGNPVAARVASAETVLATFPKNLPPLPFVFVWLVEALGGGMIWNPDPSKAAVADYSRGAREVTLVYNAEKGVFVPK